VLAKRRGDWFGELVVQPGGATPDGPSVAALAVANVRNNARIYIDVIGIGLSAYDHLKSNNLNVKAIDSREASKAHDRPNKLGFANKRAEMWWKFREALEPEVGRLLCLPPDPRLLADLCAARWKLTPRGIQVELKEETRKRLGRSPDRADAVIMALAEGQGQVNRLFVVDPRTGKLPAIKYPPIGIR
jgi:hypothetical protein